MNVVQRIGRLLGQTKHLSPRRLLLVVGWAFALTFIEIRGRRSLSDLADALSLLELIFVLIVSLTLDYDSTSLALKRMVVALREQISSLFARRLVLGVDLRLVPPIEAAAPRRWKLTLAVLSLGNGLALAGAGYLPVAPREVLHGRFYLGYLALLVGLWALLAISTFVTAFIAWGTVHDYFVTRYQGRGPRDRRPETLCLGVGLGGVLFGMLWLPAWAPLAIVAGSMAIWTIGFLGYREGFRVLWKRRDDDTVRSVDGCFATWLSIASPVLLISFLILLARGHILTAVDPISPAMFVMPITTALGIVLSWSVAVAMLTKVYSGVRLWLLRRAMSGRRGEWPVLHVTGVSSFQQRVAARRVAAEHGWRTRFAPRAARQSDVKVKLCQHLAEQTPGWPLPVTLDSLASEQTQFRLRRRNEIQLRRLMLNGLEKILKRAARLSDRSGTGWLIGPQHWFILGVSRDKESDFTQDGEATAIDMIVGPPFHVAIPLAARNYWREMCAALEIDMIFLEDGVSFRRFVRTLRVAFEIYDKHGGERRVEERDFNGLPGVRVMLHEVSMIETTHQVERGYPEPDYEDFGRARFLHIFKDRGEREEWTPTPWETDDVPLLSGR